MWISLFFILFFSNVYSAPDKLEVWFISHAKRSEVLKQIKDKQYYFYPRLASLQCQEMGEYCFDPQYGLYKKGEEDEVVSPSKVTDHADVSLPHAESVGRNIIECDSTNRFDIFCGKSKKEKSKKPKLEIWMDTSSSMREVDYVVKDGTCSRARFIKKLDADCPLNEKLEVMMFDTSIKEAGTFDSLCLNQGLNDYKKLMDWIERSEAKNLIVITDIYEFHKEFSDFVESKNGSFRGDKEVLTSEQMIDLADELAKMCN